MSIQTGPRSSRLSSVRRAPEPVERALRDGALSSRFEGFELEAEIGRGGMGSVLRARDRLLGRDVAVKVLADAPDESGQVRRFVIEAQLGAQLEHPNIVPFYQFMTTSQGRPAFAMKLVEGQTLFEYLSECASSPERARQPPHDLLSRLDRFLKVCDAIDYAHDRGVVHRDLKPENVMLGPHHEVYVMDWGVARVLDDPPEAPGGETPLTLPSDEHLTVDGDVVGTPTYMAPEQARAEPVSYATDQYALGMILAELTTLTCPRSGSATAQVTEAVMGKPPLLEPRFKGVIPRELRAVILKATAKAPTQRYPSVAELALDVRRFMRDECVSVCRDPLWLRVWRKLKRRPGLVFGVIAACLALSSALIVLGLVRELRAKELAAEQAQKSFALTSAVDRAARGVDARFRRMEMLLEGLAQAAGEVMQKPAKGQLPPLEPSDLASSELPVFLPRYGQKVAFERSVLVRSPGMSREALSLVIQRLDELEALLVRTSARAAAGDEVLGEGDRRRREVARERSPILWTDLAFESGALLVYPGNTFFPEGYEVRERTWYAEATRRFGQLWGSPYPDATSGGLIIACSQSFSGADGRLGGVAALHMRLEDVHGALAVPTVEGFRSSALLDTRGHVVVSHQMEGLRLGAGLHANRPLERPPFEVAGVRQAIVEGAREGRVFDGSRLTVFRRLDTEGWFLAVTVDAAPYGSF